MLCEWLATTFGFLTTGGLSGCSFQTIRIGSALLQSRTLRMTPTAWHTLCVQDVVESSTRTPYRLSLCLSPSLFLAKDCLFFNWQARENLFFFNEISLRRLKFNSIIYWSEKILNLAKTFPNSALRWCFNLKFVSAELNRFLAGQNKIPLPSLWSIREVLSLIDWATEFRGRSVNKKKKV